MKKPKRRYRSFVKNTKTISKKNLSFIFITIIFIILSLIFIKLGLDYKLPSIYNYNIKKDDSYIVSLKENTFYTSKTLPSGCYYASKSIDSCIIDFKYDFVGNENTNLDYNYNITASIVGKVSDNDNQEIEIWNRNFILKKDTNVSKKDINSFSINEKISIDYENYNNLARAYENKYGFTIDALLKIRFNISYTIDLSTFNAVPETLDDYIELDIPLTNTITEVNKNYENDFYKEIYPNTQNNITLKIVYYIISILFIILAIITIIINIKNHNKTPTQMYNKNINTIFKYYRDLIVTVNNIPDISNLKAMYIATLDDLIDVAEQNQCNIIHYEIVKNEKSNLYVIVGNYVYIYEVTTNSRWKKIKK